MMVGHAALAFALGAWLAHRYGLPRERALLVGFAAGAFATVPDFDMGYAFVGVLTAGVTDLSTLQETFWDVGLQVHRGMTHSLVVGGLAALGFGLVTYRGLARVAGAAILVTMAGATVVLVGALEGAVITSFVVAGVLVAAAARWKGLEPRVVLAAALIGILSHPFGDLFTGSAPSLLYPFDVRVLPNRVLLSADPTLHLLGAFAIELATIWLAFVVYLRLRDQSIGTHIHRRAVLGAGYAAAILAFPPPTLDVSYHFVFTVLAVGFVGMSADLPLPNLRSERSRRSVLLTALAAITVALVSYTVVYALLDVVPV